MMQMTVYEGTVVLLESGQTFSYVQPVEPSSLRSCDVVFQYKDGTLRRRTVDLSCDYAEHGEHCACTRCRLSYYVRDITSIRLCICSNAELTIDSTTVASTTSITTDSSISTTAQTIDSTTAQTIDSTTAQTTDSTTGKSTIIIMCVYYA